MEWNSYVFMLANDVSIFTLREAVFFQQFLAMIADKISTGLMLRRKMARGIVFLILGKQHPFNWKDKYDKGGS